MLPLEKLHALAARRGDGLRPELLALLRRRADLEANPKVADISRYDQAGPDPMPKQQEVFAQNVVAFPAQSDHEERKAQAKRK